MTLITLYYSYNAVPGAAKVEGILVLLLFQDHNVHLLQMQTIIFQQVQRISFSVKYFKFYTLILMIAINGFSHFQCLCMLMHADIMKDQTMKKIPYICILCFLPLPRTY